MDYTKTQEELIRQYNIKHLPNSTCRKRTHAHIDGSRRVCKHHIKESYTSLFTLLHEIGHIETSKKSMKRCVAESEATLWAIGKLKELGLPIKRKTTQRYKDYIKMTHARGVRRGLKQKVGKLYV
jgi:hypothetical protein